MEKSVLKREEYGSLDLHLREQMDRRGITRGEMARQTATRFEVIDKWYKGSVERLDLDVLARICYVLDCEPCDLLEYRSPDRKARPEI